jgi:serine/threonine protein kinase
VISWGWGTRGDWGEAFAPPPSLYVQKGHDLIDIDIQLLSQLLSTFSCRSLDHKNVLAFFGAIKVNTSYTSKDCRFVFVMKLCRENLRSVIFNDKRITPAKAENSQQAIDTFLKWVIEIAEGLSYIHERSLIHRHLKLENILVGIKLTCCCLATIIM